MSILKLYKDGVWIDVSSGGGASPITWKNILGKGELSVSPEIASNDKSIATTEFVYKVLNTPSVSAYKEMGIEINESDPNPESCCTYVGDAKNMQAGSPLWDDWFSYKPCVLKNGVNLGYLSKNNFKKYVTGLDAPVTGDAGGDVMIEFPRFGIKVTRDTTNPKVYTLWMTNKPNDSTYTYYAHTRGSIAKDNFYLGAYKATNVSSKLRSQPNNQMPWVSGTLTGYRNAAKLVGSGYCVSAFYQLTFIQAMYLLKYKSLDSQLKIGRGLVDVTAAQAVGATFDRGMNVFAPSGAYRAKQFGLEDIIGNVWEWIDGAFINASRNLTTSTNIDAFAENGLGYTDRGNVSTSNIEGTYVSSVFGNEVGGFIVKEATGSSSLHYCDYTYIRPNCIGAFGSSWGSSSAAGLFSWYFGDAVGAVNANVSARLMFL